MHLSAFRARVRLMRFIVLVDVNRIDLRANDCSTM